MNHQEKEVHSQRDRLANSIWEEFVDEMILNVCMTVHKAIKLNYFLLDEQEEENENEYRIIDQPGLDIFGQPLLKKQFDCVCPNCHRTLVACRFAPHLEKCMGMGRNSSRLANKRIASVNMKEESADEDDDDWLVERRSAKKKRNRGDGGRTRGARRAVKGFSSEAGLHAITADEKRGILSQICGVISERTGNMCTRSLSCRLHTEEQRRTLRMAVLSIPESVVDVDAVDPVDEVASAPPSSSNRDSVTTMELLSSSSSPGDSASTTSLKR